MRIAAIGLGNRLSGVYRHQIRKLCPEARLVGLLDPDPKAVERLPEDERGTVQRFDDLAAMISGCRPDAVMIGTRCNLHARYATALAPFRLPLFLEKPVATTLADAIALERAWGAEDSRIVVSFPLRVTPLVRQAKRWLDEPATGRMSHINAVNYVPYGAVYFNSWYRDFSITQGLFLQKATHDFDYLAFLMGRPIVRVAAMAQHGSVHQEESRRQGDGDPDVHYFPGIGTPETGMNEDCSSALIEFEGGVHGTYSQVFYARHAAAARGATLCGKRATIAFDWSTDRVRRLWHDRSDGEELLLKGGNDHGGGDTELARSLIGVVKSGTSSVAPLRAGLESVYACLAAKESAATGRFVNVRRWGQA